MGSKTLPVYTVDQYAETLMGQRISMVKGVAQVQVYGSQKYAVRIQLDPQAMATRQIGIDEVHAAVQNGNVNLPVGNFVWRSSRIHSAGQWPIDSRLSLSPADYCLSQRLTGSPGRSWQSSATACKTNRVANWWNDTDSVVLAIERQPGTNTVEVVDAVKATPSAVSRDHSAVDGDATLYDASESIRNSVADVKFTLLSGHRAGDFGHFPVSCGISPPH